MSGEVGDARKRLADRERVEEFVLDVARAPDAGLTETRAALRKEIGPPTDRDRKWQPMVSAGEIRVLLDALDTLLPTAGDEGGEALPSFVRSLGTGAEIAAEALELDPETQIDLDHRLREMDASRRAAAGTAGNYVIGAAPTPPVEGARPEVAESLRVCDRSHGLPSNGSDVCGHPASPRTCLRLFDADRNADTATWVYDPRWENR